MAAESQTVFIVEDDAALRDSLGLLLGMNGFRVQAFANADDFLRVYKPCWSGCLLLDIRMPGMSGMDLQAALRERKLAVPVIVMTAYGDIQTVRTVFRSGALDFLQKPVAPDDLLAAVRHALDRDAAHRSALRDQELTTRQLATLTARERDVLDLVCQGMHNREIAASLRISPRTVEVHKARVMEKLQVKSVSALVRIVIETARERDSFSTR